MENEQGKKTNFIGRITGRISEGINERRFRNNPNVENFLKLSEEKRRELLAELDGNTKYSIIKDLPESEKIEYIYELENEADRADIISTLSKENRDSFMSELSEDCMLEVMFKLPEEQRHDYVEMFKEGKNKIEAIKSLPKIARAYHVNKLSEELKYDYITSIPNDERGEYIEFLKDEGHKIDIIKTLPEEERFSYIDYLKTREGKIEVIKTIPEKNEILEQMSKTNSNVDEKINPNLLGDKYIEILGIERVNQISCYDEIQNRIEGLSDTKLEVIGACIDYYEANGNADEWNIITNSILKNMNEYSDLYIDIEKNGGLDGVDIDTLSKILQDGNIFGINKLEDVTLENYEKIKTQKTDEWIKSDDMSLKRKAVFEKIFGHSDLFAGHIAVGSLGTDNDNLPDCDMKDYVQSLKEIIYCEDPKVLEEIYAECKETTFVDQTIIERQIKSEYGKLYNEGLFKVEGREEDSELGEGIYSAGTDFKMIITSLGAYEENTPSNYKEDWNRPSIDTQHFCASYIRSDMIGTAEIPNVCYGFNQMSEDALIKSSTGDMGSSQRGLETGAHYFDEFYTPDEQINRTADEKACDRRPYNEMDFKRIQNGEKKQPDYIVVFRKNGQIENLDNAKKAQEDWGRDEQGKFIMPIVVVDVDECLQEQSKKVDKLMEEYVKNPSLEITKEMYYTLRNNRVTTKRWGDEPFRADIDIESVKNRIAEHEAKEKSDKSKTLKEGSKRDNEFTTEGEVNKEDLSENYSRVSARERSEGVSKFRKILNKIQEIKKGDDGIGEK